MDREILFRGKSLSNREWVYGFYTQGSFINPNTGKETIRHIIDNELLHDVDADTVGQFTGLVDKNRVKIFEGDIVRYYRVDSRCINPDCAPFNYIYEPFLKKIEGVVSYEGGMFVCEDYTPLVWCGYDDLEELRDQLEVTEEDGWCDCDGNIIDESKLGIEVIGNIHDKH